MLKGKNHSEAFERYLKGQMSPEEAHAFEREVLDDPFAQEALEGFESAGKDAFDDLEGLKRKIDQKSEKRKFPLFKLAIAASILLVGSLAIYLTIDQLDSTTELAMEEAAPRTETVQDSIAPQEAELAETLPSETESSSVSVAQPEEIESYNEIAEVQPEKPDQPEIEENNEDDFFIAEAVMDEKEAIVEAEPTPAIVAKTEVVAEDISPVRLDSISVDNIEVTPQALVATSPTQLDSNVSSLLQGQVAGVQLEDEVQEIAEKPAVARSAQARSSSPIVKRSSDEESPTITGRVTDENGEPLPGVNVMIKGTINGTQTDLDGNFRLPKLDDMVLVFSYVGFETSEVEVGARNQIDMTLGGSSEALQEVVVVGYGGQEEPSASYSPARPASGNRSYRKYIETNLRYPESARENEIEGTVTLEVTISSRGTIQNVDVKKSLGYGCDEEAIWLVREGPDWNPAERNGVNVEDKVRVKVKFKLK